MTVTAAASTCQPTASNPSVSETPPTDVAQNIAAIVAGMERAHEPVEKGEPSGESAAWQPPPIPVDVIESLLEKHRPTTLEELLDAAWCPAVGERTVDGDPALVAGFMVAYIGGQAHTPVTPEFTAWARRVGREVERRIAEKRGSRDAEAESADEGPDPRLTSATCYDTDPEEIAKHIFAVAAVRSTDCTRLAGENLCSQFDSRETSARRLVQFARLLNRLTATSMQIVDQKLAAVERRLAGEIGDEEVESVYNLNTPISVPSSNVADVALRMFSSDPDALLDREDDPHGAQAAAYAVSYLLRHRDPFEAAAGAYRDEPMRHILATLAGIDPELVDRVGPTSKVSMDTNEGVRESIPYWRIEEVAEGAMSRMGLYGNRGPRPEALARCLGVQLIEARQGSAEAKRLEGRRYAVFSSWAGRGPALVYSESVYADPTEWPEAVAWACAYALLDEAGWPLENGPSDQRSWAQRYAANLLLIPQDLLDQHLPEIKAGNIDALLQKTWASRELIEQRLLDLGLEVSRSDEDAIADVPQAAE